MVIKAKLTPQPGFIVRVGDTGLGAFRVVSTWECFKKLENDKGECLIVTTGDLEHPLSSHFREIFATERTELDAVIVAGSPALMQWAKP